MCRIEFILEIHCVSWKKENDKAEKRIIEILRIDENESHHVSNYYHVSGTL
jgi:hypothetical protein